MDNNEVIFKVQDYAIVENDWKELFYCIGEFVEVGDVIPTAALSPICLLPQDLQQEILQLTGGEHHG